MYKDAKKITDECTAELAKTTGEPVMVPRCEGLVRDVLAGLDKKTCVPPLFPSSTPIIY